MFRLQTQQYPLCNVRILTSVRATIIATRKPLARITLGCTRVAVIQAGKATVCIYIHMQETHVHTHILTSSLSLSFSLSFLFSLFPSLFLSHSHAHTHTHMIYLSPSLLLFAFSLFLSLSLSTHKNTLRYTHTPPTPHRQTRPAKIDHFEVVVIS